MVKRMVPNVMFGRYREDEFSRNQTYGIQTREEGLRITNDLSRLTLPKERKIDYAKIARMDNATAKEEMLQDEVNFMAMTQEFSLHLLDYLEQQSPYETQVVFKEFFNAPGVFDGLVNVLVQELRKSPMRPHLCDKGARRQVIDQIVHAMMDKCDEKKVYLHDFAEMVERLPILHLELEKKSLSGEFVELQSRERIKYKLYLTGYHKKCYHHWRPEDIRRVGLAKGLFKGCNTGGLLWGERGCGKS